jgi:hypothetical protein
LQEVVRGEVRSQKRKIARGPLSKRRKIVRGPLARKEIARGSF